MDTTLHLIDQLIAEHKTLGERTQALEKTANDATLLSNLKEAKNLFVLGEGSHSEDLKKLDQMLLAIDTWLKKHFSREETVLLPAVQKYGNDKLVTALNSLLFDHTELKDRLLHSRKRVDELLGGGLSPAQWDARSSDIRTHLGHTRKLLETHAAKENHYFNELKRYLKKHSKKKEQ